MPWDGVFCPCAIKQKEDGDLYRWMDMESLNRKLQERFTVSSGEPDYRSYKELRTGMDGGETGLKCAENPVTELSSRNPTIKEGLLELTVNELRELAEQEGVARYKSLKKEEITFDTEETLQQFATVIEEVNNNTRMLIHRGHTPNEMIDKYLPLTEKRMPKIVPAGTAKTATRVKKIYPNDPCPCGSGKKYKKCCGKNK